MIGLIQYAWQTDFDDIGQTVAGEFWRAPGHPAGKIDLASVGQIMAARAGESRPVCLATYRDGEWPEADDVLLSSEDPRDARPDPRLLDAWESLTGFRPQGETIAGLIRDHLTRGADPANVDGPGFLAPGAKPQIDIWLANKRIWTESFAWGLDVEYTAKLQAVLTRQLAVVRTQTLAGECRTNLGTVDYAADQKFADLICERYAGRNPQLKDEFLALIKPADWDKPLVPHETTITYNFNRADNTDIGSGAAFAYTDVAGSMRIISNAVHDESGTSATENRTRVESDLSSNDMSAQISAVSVSAATARSIGPMVRFASAADNALRCFARGL